MSYAYTPAAPMGRPFHRPILVGILAVIISIVGALILIAGILLALGLGLIGGMAFGGVGALVGAAVGLVVVIAGAITLIAGLGLWGMQSWAWYLSILVVILGIVFAGITGKVAYGLMLLYLVGVRRHFNQ